jgi:hypothetical protein
LKRVVKKTKNELNLERWDLKKMRMIGTKTFHFQKDVSSCPAVPFNDSTDDLLIVHNYKQKNKQTFCRYSESGQLLWKIRENSKWGPSSPLPNLSSEFILFGQRERSKKINIVFTNLSEGKVTKILPMPEIVDYIGYVELQGSRVAIQVMGTDKSADVYIYALRSGVMLAKLSQIFGTVFNTTELNCFRNYDIILQFSFQPKKVMVFTEGHLYSASFESDLQRTNCTDPGFTNKLNLQLVHQAILNRQLNDPESMESNTSKAMMLSDRFEKSKSEFQDIVNHRQNSLLSADLHPDSLEMSRTNKNSENLENVDDQVSMTHSQNTLRGNDCPDNLESRHSLNNGAEMLPTKNQNQILDLHPRGVENEANKNVPFGGNEMPQESNSEDEAAIVIKPGDDSAYSRTDSVLGQLEINFAENPGNYSSK